MTATGHDPKDGLGLFRAREWDDLEDWIRDPRTLQLREHPDLLELLLGLQAMVPKIDIENGMERFTRCLEATDPPEMWERAIPNAEKRKHAEQAAEILHDGLLEAVTEGEPLPATETWPAYRAEIEEHLYGYLNSEETTKGHTDFSRRAHAEQAISLLKQIDTSRSFALSQVDGAQDAVPSDAGEAADHMAAERRFIGELVAEIALLAFDAGRHLQAAWGKEFEPFALTGQKVKAGQSLSAEMRNAEVAPRIRIHNQ